MNNIEILEEFIEQYNASYPEEKEWVVIYPEQIEALENLIKEYKELKKIIFNVRHKLKGKIITKNDNIYEPAKNLTKQEVYQTFVDINIYLKANYIFKDDETVLQELLEEGE